MQKRPSIVPGGGLVGKAVLLFDLWDPGLETILQVFLIHPFTEDYEDGVIACERPQYLREGKDIEGDTHAVSMSRAGFDDSEVSRKLNGEDPPSHILDVAFFRFAYQVIVRQGVVVA